MFDFNSPLKYLANSVFQLGYVFPRIEVPIRHYTGTMGSPGFLRLDDIAVVDQTYKGVPLDCRQDIAFGFVGPFNIELIQPLSGTSSYTDFLDRNPDGGRHHIGYKVYNFHQAIGSLDAAGFPVIQTGRFGEATLFAYCDTRPALGHYTEILTFDHQTEALFEDIRNGRVGAMSPNRPAAA